MSEPRVCIECGADFNAASTGLMQCRIHPKVDDDSSMHFTCCNASLHKDECIVHYEESRPRGCHRIDHAETMAERRAMLDRPYRVIPLEHVTMSLPHAQRADGENIFHVTEDPTNRVQIVVLDASSWRSGADKTIQVDLVAESAKLRLAMDAARHDSVEDAVPDNPNSEEYYYSYGECDPAVGKSGASFVPFAIVRCMENRIDEDKRDEIQAHRECGHFA